MSGRLALRALLLLLASLCGQGLAQVPCPSFVDDEQLQRLMDPARHQATPHKLPFPDEPFLFLVIDSPEVEAELCREDTRKLLAGRAVCFSQPATTGDARKLLGDTKILALRGPCQLARFSKGDVAEWIAAVMEGRAVEMPSMADPLQVTRWTGDQWGQWVEGAWSLLAVGALERASSAILRAWTFTAGEQVFVGVRYAYLAPLLGGLLQADRERVMPVLNDLLDEAIERSRENLDDGLTARDVVALSAVLGRVDDMADLVDEYARSNRLRSAAVRFIRDDVFTALADTSHVSQALLVLGEPLQDYLATHLVEMAERRSRAPAASGSAQLDELRDQEEQAFAQRCARVALLAGDEARVKAVVQVLRMKSGTPGLAAFVRAARQVGPPSELGARVTTALLNSPDADSVLDAGEADALRAWLSD